MIVYHGSNHNFKKFKIDKKLAEHDITVLTEGYGIYFSPDINVAKSYGKYIYTCEINNKQFKDFRQLNTCIAYLIFIREVVHKRFSVDLSRLLNLRSVAEYIYYGNIQVSGVGKELQLLLDSNENWWSLDESLRDEVFTYLASGSFLPKVYMFPDSIPNIGVVKDCSSETIRLLRKDLNR